MICFRCTIGVVILAATGVASMLIAGGGKAVSAAEPRSPSSLTERQEAASPVGIFEGHGNVGAVLHPGGVEYDDARKSYSVAGSGENMWFAKDAFQYVWKKASGDISLAADVSFLGAGTERHRKACVMVRQSLDADSAYVDIALHGDGLTSLQFREAKGATTREVQANVSAPRRLRLEKRGRYVLMYLRADGESSKYSGAAARIAFEEPFYVGIGICSHNKDVTEKAVFTNVELVAPLPAATGRPVLYSSLETQSIASTDRNVVHVTASRIEAPNWLREGDTLIYNSGGRIYRIPASGGEPRTAIPGHSSVTPPDSPILTMTA